MKLEDRIRQALSRYENPKVEEQPKATTRQIQAIDNMLSPAGFYDRVQRNGLLSRIANREVKFVDDLTVGEASNVIEELKNVLTDRIGNTDDANEDDDSTEIDW
jgi:hypothetical protein